MPDIGQHRLHHPTRDDLSGIVQFQIRFEIALDAGRAAERDLVVIEGTNGVRKPRICRAHAELVVRPARHQACEHDSGVGTNVAACALRDQTLAVDQGEKNESKSRAKGEGYDRLLTKTFVTSAGQKA